MQSEKLKNDNSHRSDMLKRLYELRENLDRNSSRTPDYHINQTKDYHIDEKQDYKKEVKPKKQKKREAATQNVKNQITELFNYGFSLGRRTQISVTADTNRKYESFRFRDEFQLAPILTEYAKNADLIVFIVDTDNDSIFWYSYGAYEVRVFKK